jgi:hypothetical protein
MKATIRHQQHTFVGKLGIVLITIGMLIFGSVWAWVLPLGLGLLIGDTIEVTVEKEEATNE